MKVTDDFLWTRENKPVFSKKSSSAVTEWLKTHIQTMNMESIGFITESNVSSFLK